MPRLLSLVPGRTETTRRFVSHLVVALDGDDAAVIAVLQAMETFSGPIPVLSRAERIAIAPHIAALPHARSVAVVDAALAKAMAAPETFARGEQVRPRPKVAPVMKRKITDAEPPVPTKRQARHAPLPKQKTSPTPTTTATEQALTKIMSDLLPRHKIAHVLAVVDRGNHHALLRIMQAAATCRRQDAMAFAVSLASQPSCPTRLITLLDGNDALRMRDMIRLYACDHALTRDPAMTPNQFSLLARAAALHGGGDEMTVLNLVAEGKTLGVDLIEPLAYDYGATQLVFLLTRPRNYRFADDDCEDDNDDDKDAGPEKDVASSDTEEEAAATSVLALDALSRRATIMIDRLGRYETGAWAARLDAAVALVHLYDAIKNGQVCGSSGDMYAETARRAGTCKGRVSGLLAYGRAALACPAFVHIMTDASSPVQPPSWSALRSAKFSYKSFTALMPALQAMWRARRTH